MPLTPPMSGILRVVILQARQCCTFSNTFPKGRLLSTKYIHQIYCQNVVDHVNRTRFQCTITKWGVCVIIQCVTTIISTHLVLFVNLFSQLLTFIGLVLLLIHFIGVYMYRFNNTHVLRRFVV